MKLRKGEVSTSYPWYSPMFFKGARECCAIWLRIECNWLRTVDGESKSSMLMSLIESSQCRKLRRYGLYG